MNTWVNIPNNSDFTIYNLPFGIFSAEGTTKGAGVAIGEQIIDLNWLIIMLGSAFLLSFALVKLDFIGFLLDPSGWFDCVPKPWYRETSHVIRQTGVGRYAAITVIIAL